MVSQTALDALVVVSALDSSAGAGVITVKAIFEVNASGGVSLTGNALPLYGDDVSTELGLLPSDRDARNPAAPVERVVLRIGPSLS